MTKPQRTLCYTCKAAMILLYAVTLVYSLDDAANAYNRGRDAFLRQDFNGARSEFTQSFRLRRHPLTAFFLSYTYLKLMDFKNANEWANTALASMPPYTLDNASADGARDIANFTRRKLEPPPPPSSNQPEIKISTTPVTVLPSPPIPSPMEAPAPAIDLTGTWTSDDHGTYYVRQFGGELWWYGRDANGGQNWTNVFHGQLQGNRISGRWADVPQGQARSAGIMVLQIQGPRHLVAIEKTGGFGGSDWTR